MIDRIFDLAYFWRLAPADVLALPFSRLQLYERQALRIAEQLKDSPNG